MIEMRAQFVLQRNARLRVLPYELIPFAGARYSQRHCVHLQDDAEAVFLEIVGPGSAELPFSYSDLAFRLKAWLGDDLALLDASRIRPQETDYARALGGFTHFGSLMLLGSRFDQATADQIHSGFAEAGITGSASRLPTYGVGARFLGTSADALRRAVHHATRNLDLFGDAQGG